MAMLFIKLIGLWMQIGAFVWFICTSAIVEYTKRHGGICNIEWSTIDILNGIVVWPTLIVNAIKTIRIIKGLAFFIG